MFKRLRKQIYPLAIIFLKPSIWWNLITRSILNAQHCNFLDLCDDTAADKDDRDIGTKLSWKKALGGLDLATAIPTCGSEAAVAQELQ